MVFQAAAVKLWAATPPFLRKACYRACMGHSLASLFLPDKLETVEIMGGIGRGMRMRLNLRRERGYYLGIHELDVQSLIAESVKPGMRVYNVGAHLGFFALILSRLVGSKGTVISFEPNPEVRKRLIEHLSLNGLNGQVLVEGAALSDLDGTAEFSLTLSDTQGRFRDVPHVKPGPVIQVPCRRLDTYVKEGKVIPDFILMDVEHAEGRVIRGMARLLDKHKPIIVVELHGEAAIKESWQEFEKHDYRVAKIPGMGIVQSVNDLTYGHYLAAHSSYFNRELK
jgi:FkbM family methyltransferase